MLYDLSPTISDRLAVWTGDTPPKRTIGCHIKDGASVTVSSLTTTLHTGSHADAPCHYALDAPGIDAMPLDLYLGPAQVISVSAQRDTRFTIDDLSTTDLLAPRILFKSGTYPDPAHFNEDFAALDPDLIDWLAARDVRLIGMDTPSVDLCHSKDLPAHNACLRNNIAIIEGLMLAPVPDGVYELIALPLKIAGADGSPVRAVLRTMD
ncbi:MAG: cyclase family protein [Phycisphaerales bacterium]